MIDWIMEEGTGHYYFFAFPVCLIILLIIMKKQRIRFLIPSLLISLVILNPIFYKKWNELGLYAYWRVLWAVPVIPVLAAVIPAIVEAIEEKSDIPKASKRKRIKKRRRAYYTGIILIIIIGLAGVTAGGSFIYSNDEDEPFEIPAANSAKLPDTVVQVAERLLELKEHPRIIAEDFYLCTYIRQYSGNIDTLYGRDMWGYIYDASSTAKTTYTQVAVSNFPPVARTMLNEGYDYLVIDDSNPERKAKLTASRFNLVDSVAGFGIYEPEGNPTQIKEKNELGQVTKITYVNANGEPITGENGYAVITYEYDDDGRIIREFHMDADGEGAADSNGYAGYERAYDHNSHIIMERRIDPNGAVVTNPSGYAEVRRKYQSDHLISEAYYNASGERVGRKDTGGHAEIRREYKGDDLIKEAYYDVNGKPINRRDTGYAEIRKDYDKDHHVIAEQYFDAEGKAVLSAAGYAAKKTTYNKNGNKTSESYFDTDGSAINNINGYASCEYEYDEHEDMVVQRFRDASGNPVVTGAGYAEAEKMYDENHHVILEEYLGPDHEPYKQAAGHTAIRQYWDRDDRLILREYLDEDYEPINRSDGYARVAWEYTNGICTNIRFYNSEGETIKNTGLNLAKDIQYGADGWSDWITPAYNTSNSCQNIGYLNLGHREENDEYSCYIEIEFKGVQATGGYNFRFRTQGAQDGKWFTKNIWTNNLINLSEVPQDGVYTYHSSNTVSSDMINVNTFNIGFRCDYWSAGSYRVRKVMIKKGKKVSKWSPGI